MPLRLLACGFALFLSLPCPAKPGANSLNADQMQKGVLLLFDGETTLGWKSEGDVSIAEGALILGRNQRPAHISSLPFQNCVLEFQYTVTGHGTATFETAGQAIDLPARANDPAWVQVSCESEFSGTGSYRLSCTSSLNPGKPTEFQLKQSPQRSPFTFRVTKECQLKLRQLTLTPRKSRNLFNGKDLSGWKVFADPQKNKSQWTVTKEGNLNVKNGPGDLQSTATFGNFLLQFECISHGKWLNSGLFFRCVAQEYQNGYEMQIQNGFKEGDRSKPVDYGTGAIYRRVPARTIVSDDQVWFTMTLYADGNHFATWVNGYQTVDWTDNRPAHNNPRKGARSAAGHISLQGHDPTTNLSFRNIRIEEFKDDR